MKEPFFGNWIGFGILTLALSASTFAKQAEIDTPSDSQVIGIVIAANTGEIAASELAIKSANKGVRNLAKMMIVAHSNSNDEVEKLATSIDLQQSDSQESLNLKKSASDQLVVLKKLKGKKFDKVYIDELVDAHTAVLKELNEKLIPSTQNFDLKKLLVQTRDVVEAHLQHAKQIQASIL